jgi:hypothetical protein
MGAMRRSRARALVGALGLSMALATSSCAARDDETRELLLTFDQSPLAENEGIARTRVAEVTANGGDILSVAAESSGRAIRLPGHSSAPDAPRAMVVVTDVTGDGLNPLASPFWFGADFSLDSTSVGTDLDNGDNLMQRGLFDDASQFKLEVDGGKPTCRVKGSDGAVLVRSSMSVNRQEWYRVYCERREEQITLSVLRLADGKKWAATKKGATGSLDFPENVPLSIGGKVGATGEPEPSADQFNGAVDEAMVDITS